jgi:hypothetical protein
MTRIVTVDIETTLLLAVGTSVPQIAHLVQNSLAAAIEVDCDAHVMCALHSRRSRMAGFRIRARLGCALGRIRAVAADQHRSVGGASMSDEDREVLIRAHCTVGTFEVDPEKASRAFARMGELIAGRSQEQIEAMERARGLR